MGKGLTWKQQLKNVMNMIYTVSGPLKGTLGV
jgi:hypothetical protein